MKLQETQKAWMQTTGDITRKKNSNKMVLSNITRNLNYIPLNHKILWILIHRNLAFMIVKTILKPSENLMKFLILKAMKAMKVKVMNRLEASYNLLIENSFLKSVWWTRGHKQPFRWQNWIKSERFLSLMMNTIILKQSKVFSSTA